MSCEQQKHYAFRGRGLAGFTLVELVVVMVLISLFMVFSIPLFSNIGTSSLGTSARRLSGTIKYLFNESAISGLEYRLVYDLDQGLYRAQILEANGEQVDAPDQGREAELRGDVRFMDLQLPGRGKFTMGQITTRIHPSGWVEETIIHLDDGAGEMLTLRVSPLTGTTEVFDGYREF
ncbi:prepilin-type N-terminal cleavage/methylation domain-containing protein [Deltaproteobacteria bacterium IMCC39524]|nr:prepilin-type N-terminal cleavage/methylation domain-containing protein [Deltaproteobacteria bacterium IMCC39524]